MSSETSRASLLLQLAIRLPTLILFLVALLFGTAGTFDYAEAWLYLLTVLGCTLPALTWLMIKEPELLARRLRVKEKERVQKRLMAGTTIYALLAYSLPGFDHRFGWSEVPWPVVVGADLAFVAAYILFVRVLRENRWASRVIEVAPEQPVISTGPYALIRHPMYAANLIITFASPIALGSWWAVLAMLPMIWVLVRRIGNEEEVLLRDLEGYGAYRERVRYRLLPLVW